MIFDKVRFVKEDFSTLFCFFDTNSITECAKIMTNTVV